MVGSMLKYAEESGNIHNPDFDFRIVFMGASQDAMTQKPFSNYPDKLLKYEQLGVEAVIDRNWKRDSELSESDLEKLSSLQAREKVCVGTSCAIQDQLVKRYQKKNTRVLTIRDNPSPEGETDYFPMAKRVEESSRELAVPSQACKEKINGSRRVTVVGHGPLEGYVAQAATVDKDKVKERLGLDPTKPILVYAGVYGDYYESCFKLFLELINNPKVASALQVLIVPHPRFLGEVEKRLCTQIKTNDLKWLIAAEFEKEPARQVKTVEAIAIADFLVIADATSTVVFQAGGLGKKVIHINPNPSTVSEDFYRRGLLIRVESTTELLDLTKPEGEPIKDVFDLMGIPRNGAQRLWQEVVGN